MTAAARCHPRLTHMRACPRARSESPIQGGDRRSSARDGLTTRANDAQPNAQIRVQKEGAASSNAGAITPHPSPSAVPAPGSDSFFVASAAQRRLFVRALRVGSSGNALLRARVWTLRRVAGPFCLGKREPSLCW